MKANRFILACLLSLFVTGIGYPQVTSDYAVMLTATIDSGVSRITLKWPHDPVATAFTVYRKLKSSTTWDLTLASLPGSDSTYIDNTVIADSAYEYQVQKNEPSLTGYGYIYCGTHLPPTEYRGKLILLVDSVIGTQLTQPLTQLMKDISGDGWAIIRHDVSSGISVEEVKTLIEADYAADPSNVKCVFLFGHVAVPYSGDLNPDGHPDHLGAWPADLFYGDLYGDYTDQYVDDTGASRPDNWNVPGDGKYDPSNIASLVNLQIGRVDLRDMPSFPSSEVGLLAKYLFKDHAYRTHQITPQLRGLIDDNFGVHGGEAFAANGWRNFSTLVGTQHIDEADYFTTLQHQSYLWSYACGGGWYQGADGVGSITDFANDTVLTVFTMLFGSYFGDWDNQDNFLRAPLASTGYALTCAWAGRPNWQFHHMALGETIGYCTWLSQNNPGTYVSGYGRNGVHVALMGDPTLRMHPIAPVSSVVAAAHDHDVGVTWQATTDPVLGYYVYRSTEPYGIYSRISTHLVTGLAFTDSTPASGVNYYMVRGMALQQTPSGSYYNLSTGVTDSAMVYISIADFRESTVPGLLIYPNPASSRVNLQFSKDLPGGCRIRIFDPTGREVITSDLPEIRKYLPYSISLDAQSPGLYLLSAYTPEGVITRKLQIVR